MPTVTAPHALRQIAALLRKHRPDAVAAAFDFDGQGPRSLYLPATLDSAGNATPLNPGQTDEWGPDDDALSEHLSDLTPTDLAGLTRDEASPSRDIAGRWPYVVDLASVPLPDRESLDATVGYLRLTRAQARTLLGLFDSSDQWHNEWDKYVRRGALEDGTYTPERAEQIDAEQRQQSTLNRTLTSEIYAMFPGITSDDQEAQ